MLLPATLWHSKGGPAGLAGKQGEVWSQGLAAVFNTPLHRVSGKQWWNLKAQAEMHPRKWCSGRLCYGAPSKVVQNGPVGFEEKKGELVCSPPERVGAGAPLEEVHRLLLMFVVVVWDVVVVAAIDVCCCCMLWKRLCAKASNDGARGLFCRRVFPGKSALWR